MSFDEWFVEQQKKVMSQEEWEDQKEKILSSDTYKIMKLAWSTRGKD